MTRLVVKAKNINTYIVLLKHANPNIAFAAASDLCPRRHVFKQIGNLSKSYIMSVADEAQTMRNVKLGCQLLS